MTQLIERFPVQTRVATIVVVVVAIVSMTVTLVKKEDSVLARLDTIECNYRELVIKAAKDYSHLATGINEMNSKNHSTEIELAKINTKLAAIEGLLVDLRAMR